MALTTFLFLIVIIDPIALAPVFLRLTRKAECRKSNAIKASLFAFVLGTLAILFGKNVQLLIGMSDQTLQIIGGSLLLKTGILLLLPHKEVPKKSFIPSWLYPLSFPLIVGPGVIIYLIAKSGIDDLNLVFGLLAACATTGMALIFATSVVRYFGDRTLQVLEVVGAIVLIILSIGLILHGLSIDITSFIG